VDSDQAALSGRIGTVQATANGLEESIGTLGTDVDDVKGKTAGLEESAARTAMELKNLNEGQDELNGRVDESKATAHNMKATLGGLETKTTNVEEQTALLETAMTEKFGEVDEEMATLNSKIGIAQATADGLKGRMDTLETSWDEAKNRLNEFKTKVKAVIEALPQDLTQAEKRIAAKLAKRVTVVTGEIDAKVLKAQQTADSAQANVSTLEGAMGEAFDNADSVQAALNSKIGTAQATADGLQKQAESLEGEQSKQRDALEKATGPAYEGAEAVGELREETTKKLLVEVLRADNYTDHLKEVKGKHGPETVKALLQALTSNPEFVKETLARWHYGTGMKELRESRETPKKEWVENTAKIIVMRAQECARGDV